MTRRPRAEDDATWGAHAAAWRDPAQIASQWQQADAVDPRLLKHSVRGAWWETLAERRLTLLVTREYEHLVVAMSARDGRPRVSFMPMPHPSGLAVDRAGGAVHIASTRNPNMLFDLAPASRLIRRPDTPYDALGERPLVPVRARFVPGCLYMHDLALVGGALFANAVGMNAVVRLDADGRYAPVWWPLSVETPRGPLLDRNYLQLNSIAAGDDLASSFFSASAAAPLTRRPGHRNFPVDGRGVIFSGATREPIAFGLTRPHSARLHGGRLWVCNSGYGEIGYVEDGRLTVVARLPGWTRGLCFAGDVAFVATSRVIPRFRQYAPGLGEAQSVCGVHAVGLSSGEVLGSLRWPVGNQNFAVEWLPEEMSRGFALVAGRRRNRRRDASLFYAFETGR